MLGIGKNNFELFVCELEIFEVFIFFFWTLGSPFRDGRRPMTPILDCRILRFDDYLEKQKITKATVKVTTKNINI